MINKGCYVVKQTSLSYILQIYSFVCFFQKWLHKVIY